MTSLSSAPSTLMLINNSKNMQKIINFKFIYTAKEITMKIFNSDKPYANVPHNVLYKYILIIISSALRRDKYYKVIKIIFI